MRLFVMMGIFLMTALVTIAPVEGGGPSIPMNESHHHSPAPPAPSAPPPPRPPSVTPPRPPTTRPVVPPISDMTRPSPEAPSPEPSAEAPEPGTPEAVIAIYQTEIERRIRTNGELQEAIDSYNVERCKELVGAANTLTTATGGEGDAFKKQPKEIQAAAKDFESGHWGRDVKQASRGFLAAMAAKFTGGDATFYLDAARTEIKRNNLFIEMLKEKIVALKGESQSPSGVTTSK